MSYMDDLDFRKRTTSYHPPEGTEIYWVRHKTQDGHGGNSLEHRQEMRNIAEEVAEQKIKELVPQMAREIYRQSIKDVLHGLEYDVNSAVNVAFKNGKDIFSSSKAQKMISDSIKKEVVKGLRKREYKL